VAAGQANPGATPRRAAKISQQGPTATPPNPEARQPASSPRPGDRPQPRIHPAGRRRAAPRPAGRTVPRGSALLTRRRTRRPSRMPTWTPCYRALPEDRQPSERIAAARAMAAGGRHCGPSLSNAKLVTPAVMQALPRLTSEAAGCGMPALTCGTGSTACPCSPAAASSRPRHRTDPALDPGPGHWHHRADPRPDRRHLAQRPGAASLSSAPCRSMTTYPWN
jgi:hypothetical protein